MFMSLFTTLLVMGLCIIVGFAIGRQYPADDVIGALKEEAVRSVLEGFTRGRTWVCVKKYGPTEKEPFYHRNYGVVLERLHDEDRIVLVGDECAPIKLHESVDLTLGDKLAYERYLRNCQVHLNDMLVPVPHGNIVPEKIIQEMVPRRSWKSTGGRGGSLN